MRIDVNKSAGEPPFSKYPDAPYFKALKIKSSSSNVVKIITLISGYFSLTYLVQTVPSIMGILTSIKMMSGLFFSILANTSLPFPTVSVTEKSLLLSRIILIESLISCWSSAINILIILNTYLRKLYNCSKTFFTIKLNCPIYNCQSFFHLGYTISRFDIAFAFSVVVNR